MPFSQMAPHHSISTVRRRDRSIGLPPFRHIFGNVNCTPAAGYSSASAFNRLIAVTSGIPAAFLLLKQATDFPYTIHDASTVRELLRQMIHLSFETSVAIGSWSRLQDRRYTTRASRQAIASRTTLSCCNLRSSILTMYPDCSVGVKFCRTQARHVAP